MDWLTQNWIWLALGIGAFLVMRRYGFGHYAGGHAGHGHGSIGGQGAGEVEVSPAQIGRDGGHGAHGVQPDRNAPSNVPEATIDPVNGEPVRTDKALTSLYQGAIYYFASRENRDRFEAAPQEYAQKAVGHPVAASEERRPRRRHGC